MDNKKLAIEQKRLMEKRHMDNANSFRLKILLRDKNFLMENSLNYEKLLSPPGSESETNPVSWKKYRKLQNPKIQNEDKQL